MRAKCNFFKILGAVTLGAVVVFGTLTVNLQPISAAAGFSVADQKYEKAYKLDDGKVYFEAKGAFPEITDDSEAAKKINQALTEEKNQWIQQTKKEAADAKSDFDFIRSDGKIPMPEWHYTDDLTYEVTANDGDYFSVLMSGYLFRGGAHGSPYRVTMTFDAKTGEKLTASKLFGTTRSKLNAMVRELYLQKYDKEGTEKEFYGEGKSGRADLVKALAPKDFDNAFYVKNGDVVFYAYPYELGPYVSGFIETTATLK